MFVVNADESAQFVVKRYQQHGVQNLFFGWEVLQGRLWSLELGGGDLRLELSDNEFPVMTTEVTLTYLKQNGVTTNPSLQVMLCGKPPFWGNYNEQLRRTNPQEAAVSPCCYLKFCREVHETITIPSGTYMQEEKSYKNEGLPDNCDPVTLTHTPFGRPGWNVRHSQWVTARGSRFRVQRRCTRGGKAGVISL